MRQFTRLAIYCWCLLSGATLWAADDSGARHWAFRAPTRPGLPPVKNGGWVRGDIDRFILARLEEEGLSPSPQADRVALIRRLSLDLIGLPPTIEQVDAFLEDRAERTYERVV